MKIIILLISLLLISCSVDNTNELRDQSSENILNDNNLLPDPKEKIVPPDPPREREVGNNQD